MFTLKTNGEDSSELLARLCKETFFQAYKDDHAVADLESYCKEIYSVDSIEKLLSSRNTLAVVAFQESDPAGFHIVEHHQCPVDLSGVCTELKQIYVLSNYFGGGLGHDLFSNATEIASAKGSTWLWLCVSDKNCRARIFYKKLGFDKAGEGPVLVVGDARLPSSILALNISTKSS